MKKYAAIFDFDGVVIDSGAEHLKSWEMLAAMHGKTLPEGFLNATFGMRNIEIIPNILKWTDILEEAKIMSEQKEVCYRDIVRKDGVPMVAGVVGFLKALCDNSIPTSVGSSTPIENLQVLFEKLDIGKYFTAYVGMEDVERGKPDPQVFLEAARRLGVPPCDCCVFEDSVAGIEAAEAAGMKRVALATTNPMEFWQKRGDADSSKRVDAIIEDFSKFSLRDFLGLFE